MSENKDRKPIQLKTKKLRSLSQNTNNSMTCFTTFIPQCTKNIGHKFFRNTRFVLCKLQSQFSTGNVSLIVWRKFCTTRSKKMGTRVKTFTSQSKRGKLEQKHDFFCSSSKILNLSQTDFNTQNFYQNETYWNRL